MAALKFMSDELRSQYYERAHPQTRLGCEALAAAHANSLPLWVSAVIKNSPTHMNGESVDLTYFFQTRTTPYNVKQSLRLTDKRILHARLLAQRWPCAIVIENDHYHVSNAVAPGVYIFDAPREIYSGEKALLTNPRVRANYRGELFKLIRLG